MWSHSLGDTGFGRGAFDDAPRPDAREWLSPRVEQEPSPALPPVECRSERVQVDRDRADDAAADGDEPLFATLAEDSHEVFGEEQIGDDEPAQLGYAEAGAIRQ